MSKSEYIIGQYDTSNLVTSLLVRNGT